MKIPKHMHIYIYERIETEIYTYGDSTLRQVSTFAGPGPHEAEMLKIQMQNEYEVMHYGTPREMKVDTPREMKVE